jgi:hypothetical protein
MSGSVNFLVFWHSDAVGMEDIFIYFSSACMRFRRAARYDFLDV